MTVKLLTEHHLEFLSLKGGCTGLSESTLVKMPHCWNSHGATRLSVGGRGSCSVVSVGVKVLVSLTVTSYALLYFDFTIINCYILNNYYFYLFN